MTDEEDDNKLWVAGGCYFCNDKIFSLANLNHVQKANRKRYPTTRRVILENNPYET